MRIFRSVYLVEQMFTNSTNSEKTRNSRVMVFLLPSLSMINTVIKMPENRDSNDYNDFRPETQN